MCCGRKPAFRKNKFGKSKLIKNKLPIPPEPDKKQDNPSSPTPPYDVQLTQPK